MGRVAVRINLQPITHPSSPFIPNVQSASKIQSEVTLPSLCWHIIRAGPEARSALCRSQHSLEASINTGLAALGWPSLCASTDRPALHVS
jgi:hypothetical protein